MTVRDLIAGSLRLLGVVASGETATAAEQADALATLNDMLESWSIDGFLINKTIEETFDLASGVQTYTMGDDGDFDTVKPVSIKSAAIKSGDIETPIDIVNDEDWATITAKNAQSTIPLKLYYDNSAVLGSIKVWPVPSAACEIVLYSNKQTTSFATVNDTIILPPGYPKALKYCLAVELAPEYGKQADPLIINLAVETKASLMRNNTKPVYMRSDLKTGKPFNILTGE